MPPPAEGFASRLFLGPALRTVGASVANAEIEIEHSAATFEEVELLG
jgi:hypothetical protein